MSSLVRLTLAEQARDALLAEILSGGLRPGMRLLPVELAERLGVSATPLKEALLMLEVDGLVSGSARKSVSVRIFTGRDIDELFEVRALIERTALIKLLAKTSPIEVERQLRSDLNDQAGPYSLGSGQAFSRQLVRLGGLSMMRQMHASVLGQIAVAAAPGQLKPFADVERFYKVVQDGNVRAAVELLGCELASQQTLLRDSVG